MTGRIDTEPRALHVVRCSAMATADKLRGRLGLADPELCVVLEPLTAADLIVHREGPMEFWAITPAGKQADDAALRAELQATGTRSAVAASYERFTVLNGPMLQLCNDWQVRDVGGEQVPNTHDDAPYDRAILARLRGLDTGVQPILDNLERVLPRFGRYRPALASALAKLEDGESAYLTGVRVDSYHTVWFELHEDLLVTLGISREDEALPRATRP